MSLSRITELEQSIAERSKKIDEATSALRELTALQRREEMELCNLSHEVEVTAKLVEVGIDKTLIGLASKVIDRCDESHKLRDGNRMVRIAFHRLRTAVGAGKFPEGFEQKRSRFIHWMYMIMQNDEAQKSEQLREHVRQLWLEIRD